MTILVIGSEGFIGSNAVRYFIKKGDTVHCADIVLKEEKNYIVINPEFPDFARLFYNQKYDVCINASGAANVQFSFSHAAMDFTLNVSNVFHMLEAIRQFNPTCKFINFSSASVYGNPQALPVSENAFIDPLSPYACHKFLSEKVCSEFYSYFKIPTISLRVFSTFGPGLKKQLFWDLYTKTKEASKIKLSGTGKESRDFIYITDLINAIDLIIHNVRFSGSVINVANGDEIFINEAARIFYKNFNRNLKYKFSCISKIGYPANWKADISILKSIGYKQDVSFEQGILKYIEWLRELE